MQGITEALELQPKILSKFVQHSVPVCFFRVFFTSLNYLLGICPPITRPVTSLGHQGGKEFS